MEYVLSIIGIPEYSLRRILSPLAVFGHHLQDHFIPHARNNYRPYVLSHRSLALLSGLVVTIKIFTIAALAWGPVVPAFSSAITPENIINLTNQSRLQFGQSILTENSILDKAAQAKADDMLAKGYFAHVTPEGKTPWSFITTAGYNYLIAGENLAVNFTEAENVETAWMNSPGHRANILNKDFQEIGIGISQGDYQGHNAIFVVQEFGTPVEQKIAINNLPTAVQASAIPEPKTASSTLAEAQSKKVASSFASTMATEDKLQTTASQSALKIPAAVSIESGSVKPDGQNVNIVAQVTGPAVKVLAYFGNQAVMLLPKDQTTWVGQAETSILAKNNATVKLKVFGMQNQSSELQLADFSSSTMDNYNLAATTPVSYVSFLGQNFNPNVFERNFYLFLIAGLLTSLILAIGFKRHIQHLSLIANSSFVIMFIALLLWAG